MKKLIHISFIFAFIMAFGSCEKESIFPHNEDGEDIWGSEYFDMGECGDDQTRGHDGDFGGEVTDPDDDEDEDEDENNVVDPDDDDDEDQNENGIVDPDDDEDFDEDEGK